jgi:hypothetical protein
MNHKINIEIEKLLDDWDPIGILQDAKPIDYSNFVQGEYTSYVEPIIQTFISKKSIKEYLVKLYTKLMHTPNFEVNNQINELSYKIDQILSTSLSEFQSS